MGVVDLLVQLPVPVLGSLAFRFEGILVDSALVHARQPGVEDHFYRVHPVASRGKENKKFHGLYKFPVFLTSFVRNFT